MAKTEDVKTSEFKQIAIVTRYELLKHLRRRRLYAVLIITALITALQLVIPIVFNIPFPEQAKAGASSFFGFVSLLVIITGAFFAGDAIASEFENKTGFIIFPNPVKRVSIVLGKFAAAFFSSLLAIGLYYAIGAGALLGIYGAIPLETAFSFAYAILSLCSVLGLSLLFSAVLKGSMGATLLAFFTLFMIMPIASSVLMLTGNEPWYLSTYASGMITQTINPQNDTVIQIPGSSFKVYTFYPKFPVSVIVMFAYFVVSLALSIVITNRKEMA